MSHAPEVAQLTLEDWAALDEDEPGELVDGVLEDEEVPSVVHELLVGLLCERFRAWTRPDGLVLGSESKLAVAPRRGRKPDVVVWFGDSPLPDPRASLARVPPDVAVEIVTPTPRDVRRDRVAKYDEYAAFGIRFYWIVDPEVRTVEVFALKDGAYTRAVGATEGTIAVPGIDGATWDVDAAWREVDELLRRYAEQDR